MQRMALVNRQAIDDLVHAGISDIVHIHHKGDRLAGKSMIGIERNFSVRNAADAEGHALALLILHFDFRTDTAEFGRRILDIIGKRQVGVVRAKTLSGVQQNLNPVANPVPVQRQFDFFEQGAIAPMNVSYRYI